MVSPSPPRSPTSLYTQIHNHSLSLEYKKASIIIIINKVNQKQTENQKKHVQTQRHTRLHPQKTGQADTITYKQSPCTARKTSKAL